MLSKNRTCMQNDTTSRTTEDSADRLWARKKEIASKYDLLSGIYEEVYREEQMAKYQTLFPNLEKNKKMCLEIGCGTGIGIDASGKDFCETWIGIDISRGMLKETKRRIQGRENKHLILADADFAPVRSNCADVGICVTLLSKTPRPSTILEELKRAVVQGGDIAVTGLKKEFTKDDFRELILKSGLNICKEVATEEDVKDHVFVCSGGRYFHNRRSLGWTNASTKTTTSRSATTM